MDFKEITKFLGVAGTVAAPFTPIGGGLILASKALEKMADFDSQSAKTDFIGLEAFGNELKNMVETDSFDKTKLSSIADSLIALSAITSKFTKMIG